MKQLKQWNFQLIDCQVQSEHIDSLGAELIPRTQFVRLLENLCYLPNKPGPWQFDEITESI